MPTSQHTRRILYPILLLASLLVSQSAWSYETQLITDFTISSISAKSPDQYDTETTRFSVDLGDRSLNLLVRPSRLIENLVIDGLIDPIHSYAVYEGVVENIPHSWVRITRFEDQAFGLIDVGDKRFQVSTSVQDLAGRSTDEMQSLIAIVNERQRLAKSIELFPVRSLVSGKPFNKVLNIGIVVDELFNAKFNGRGVLRAIAIINSVDGIYREELGIAVKLAVAILAKDQDFSRLGGATPAQLNQFRQFRQQTAELRRPLTLVHLFTGSNPPTGSSGVGYAFIGSICKDTGYDIGVSAQFSLDTELAAHEIGHNIGALHDSDTVACRTDSSHIMSPVLSGATAFSSCSLEKINATLKDASCVSEAHDGSIRLRRSGTSGFIVQVQSTSGFSTPVSSEVLIRYEGQLVTAPSYCYKEGEDTLNCTLPLLTPNETFEFFVNLTPSTGQSREIVAEYNEEGVFELNNLNNIASLQLTGSGAEQPLSNNTGSLFVQPVPSYTNLQSNTPVTLVNAKWGSAEIVRGQMECKSHYWNSSQRQYVADNTSYYRYKHTAYPGNSNAGDATVAYYVRGSDQIVTSTALNQQPWNIDGGRYSGPAPFARSAYVEVVGVSGDRQNAVRSWTSNTTFDLCTAYPDAGAGLVPQGGTTDAGSCVDTPPANDGWGWNGQSSCRIARAPQPIARNDAAIVFNSTTRSVNINGRLESYEWEPSTTKDTNGAALTLPVAIAGIRVDRGIDQWKVMHDADNLYIALVVPDKTPFKDSVLYRHDDSVEIFIDAGNERGIRYDQNDSQFILRESGEVSGIFNSNTQIVHSRRYVPENQHFVYEIKISKFYFQLSGQSFGLNIQVNNDQNGGLQDAKWGWVGETGVNVQWFRPSSFGQACLDTGVITSACKNSSQPPMPIAQGSCVDTGVIGDGWGWNGMDSCRVSGNSTCIDTGVIGDGWGWNGTESCRMSGGSACVDTGVIGDGWGWNGTESCRIGGGAVCVDTGVIGDGWGWDGSRSCAL